MWYVVIPLAILTTLLVVGRLLSRRALPAPQPALTPVPVGAPSPAAEALPPVAHPVPLRAAPGAPNTDPPTDRHVTPRGTASIHRRTGRRTSTGG